MDSVGFIALFVSFFFGFTAAADASTQTSSRVDMWKDFLSLDVVDFIRAGAIYLGLLVPMFRGRRTWIMAIIIISAFGALGNLFFPKQMLSSVLMKSSPDIMHEYLLQMIAIVSLGRLVHVYESWESRDPGVMSSVLMSASVTSIVLVLTSLFDYNKYHSLMSPSYVSLGFNVYALVGVGCILYTFKGSSFGKGNLDFRHRLSRHILFDVMALFGFTFWHFGYPNSILSFITLEGFRPNGVHAHLVRVLGVAVFGAALNGFMALGYQNEKDQKSYVLGRLIMYAVMFPLLGLYEWKYKIITWTVADQIAQFIIAIAVLGNLLCAYFEFDWPKLKSS